jgi:hypothetical protein
LAPAGTTPTTRHGLTLVARATADRWPRSTPVIVPGFQAARALPWLTGVPAADTLTSPERFPFGAALEELARRQDRPTARFTARRLEYRLPEGQAAPGGPGWATTAVVWRPLLLGLLGVALVAAARRLRRRNGGLRPHHPVTA